MYAREEEQHGEEGRDALGEHGGPRGEKEDDIVFTKEDVDMASEISGFGWAGELPMTAPPTSEGWVGELPIAAPPTSDETFGFSGARGLYLGGRDGIRPADSQSGLGMVGEGCGKTIQHTHINTRMPTCMHCVIKRS